MTPNTEPRCQDCTQRHKGLFCNLAAPALGRLDQVKNVEHYRPGDVIFFAGQKPRALFCVYSGRVKIFKVGARDEEQVIYLLGPADLTGYRSILAGESYSATAEAIEPATLCAFPPQTIFDLLRDSPDFSVLLLARLARDLRMSQEYMLVQAQEPARQRIARFLIWFHAGEAAKQSAEPVVQMKHAEIARIVGTTPETFSRVLHDLASRTFVRLDRTNIVITDLPGLRKVALGLHRPA